MVEKKRAGNLSLTGFSRNKPEPTPQPEPSEPVATPEPTPKTNRRKASPKVTTINIKIDKKLHRWLLDTAGQVRENNDEPVPAPDRVYPQHLIGLAVQLLKSADVDWTKIKTIADLENHLKL